MLFVMYCLYLILNVYCPSVSLHANYCVTVLLLNCVRATVSTISVSICAYIDLFFYCIWLLINKDTFSRQAVELRYCILEGRERQE